MEEYKYYVWTEERGEGGKPHLHAASMSLAEAIEIADKEQKNTTANVYVTEHAGKTIYGITLSKQPRTSPLGSS
jgi:uncharacterized membrane protein YkoI